MARLATSWNEIQAGDIISFKYKSERTGKSKEHTILVLNPKWYITVEGKRMFQVIGLRIVTRWI